jgi:hypothetical protein
MIGIVSSLKPDFAFRMYWPAAKSRQLISTVVWPGKIGTEFFMSNWPERL